MWCLVSLKWLLKFQGGDFPDPYDLKVVSKFDFNQHIVYIESLLDKGY